MQLMEWSERFITGIEPIDTQHRGLVDLLNAAAPALALAGDAPAQEARQLLEYLENYAAAHFRFEETLMAERGIDRSLLDQHQKRHADFVRQIARMRDAVNAGDSVSGHAMLRFLTEWLAAHMINEDQAALQPIGALAAGQAVGGASENPGQAVIIDALIELFAVKVKHGQMLSDANRALGHRERTREQELERANASLAREQQLLLESMSRIEQAQSQLLQSEKMAAVGQLAAGIAHEINNPIGFVSSNLSSLAAYVDRLFLVIAAYEQVAAALPASHPACIAAQQACREAELDYLRGDIPDLLRESDEGLSRVKAIVRDLKDFSRMDEAEWQEADLHRGLESTLNVVWHEIRYKAEVIQDLGDLPLVSCIPSQINQVFMNLLINAAQSIEATGTITLRTGIGEGEIWVEIADTGVGIPTEIRKRIFEPFYTTKPVGKGTGLGLSITWDIIQRHDGRIEVESQPGLGTTFRITLPVERRQPSNSREAA